MDHAIHQPFALAVDDDPLILMDACAILEDGGFQALEAGDADAALAILEEYDGRVQLLFTDVQMPGRRDGFALARAVAERWSHIKILVASGNIKPGPDDMPEGAAFIGKPFSAEVIHTRLKELLPDGQKPEPLRD